MDTIEIGGPDRVADHHLFLKPHPVWFIGRPYLPNISVGMTASANRRSLSVNRAHDLSLPVRT